MAVLTSGLRRCAQITTIYAQRLRLSHLTVYDWPYAEMTTEPGCASLFVMMEAAFS
jgi:hypothetical protein